MKWIQPLLIFLLIPLVFSDIATINKTIHAGLNLLGLLGPEAAAVSQILGFVLNYALSNNYTDPNAKIINEINNARQQINNRLDDIEKELSEGKEDILNEITGSIYVNGLGRGLDTLYSQLNTMIIFFDTINGSKIYSENEKNVEIAFLIGNNAEWLKEGNMVFNLRKLAEVLSGNTFTQMNNRDLYQIVYDANIPNCMFSGEVYDNSSPYIEKVMQIYLYGCSAIFYCLKNSLLVSNFTAEEIEALSPLIKNHYYQCAIGEPQLILDEFEFIADKVYNITSSKADALNQLS